MTPSPGTARYELLCSFLEDVLRDPKTSKRLKMSAAQRLDGLLQRAERKEASEARRAEREAVRAVQAQREASKSNAIATPEGVSAREAEERLQHGLKLMHEVLGGSSQKM